MSTFYAVSLIIAATISTFAVTILWKRRVNLAAQALMFFMISLLVWSLTYAFHWLSPTPEQRNFWLIATYLGVVPTSVCAFIFAFAYTHHEHLLTRRNLILLSVFPILTILIMWTDPWHGLFFGGQAISGSRIFDGGIWFWLHIVYSYSLIAAAYWALVREWSRARDLYRDQVRLVLLAISIPVMFNVGGFLGLFPLPAVDPTPLLFTLTGTIIIYALYYRKLFDIVPLARDRVMQTMSEAFFIVDSRDRIIDLNEAANRLCQDMQITHPSSLIGSSMSHYFPDWLSWLQSPEATGEFELLPPTYPIHRTFEWRITPIIGTTGNPQGYLCLLNNISRRKMAVKREIELTLEKERVKLLREFIQNTAHEIRTPLTAISTAAYLMTRIDDREARAAKGEQTMRQVEQITRILSMALLLVELENQDIELNEQVHIPHLLSIILEGMEGKFPATITVETIQEEKIPTVSGKISYLNEVFRQLIDNAYRYSPEHGTITIHVFVKNSMVYTEIRDQGKGIPDNQKDKIFNALWREDEARSSRGFGLGLSLAKRIVDLHRGTIEIESEAGSGTMIRTGFPQ